MDWEGKPELTWINVRIKIIIIIFLKSDLGLTRARPRSRVERVNTS